MLEMRGVVQGRYDPKFEALASVFAGSFNGDGDAHEHGAQLAVFKDGRLMVDLWGGWEDAERQVPLREHGLICTYSAIKGPAALIPWLLAEEGLLDLHEPIAAIWPEFGRNGKEAITPWHVLTHQAGIYLVADDVRGLGFDQDPWRVALEEAPARHTPGAERWYHAITYGFILAELALRAAGEDFRQLFWERVAGPLAADVHVGVPPAMLARTVSVLPPIEPANLQGFGARAIIQLSSDPGSVNGAAARTSINPASFGFVTARGCARLYAALANDGELEGVRIAAAETVQRMTTEVWDDEIQGLGARWRVAGGLHLSSDFSWFGPGRRAFGHPGMGGGTAFADPDTGLAFAYFPVRLYPGGGTGARSRRLVDALYECLPHL